MRSRCSSRITIALLCGMMLCLPVRAGAASQPEYQVKAAFLFNFARYTVWPPGKFAAADSPVQFCVLDNDAFAAALEETLQGKIIGGRALAVRRAARADELRGCHVAYVGALAPPARIAAALGTLVGSGTLSVYEGDDTQRSGGIRFFLDERKVRFEINTGATSRENLELNSRLLNVATVVQK